jgi:hypothetical protein
MKSGFVSRFRIRKIMEADVGETVDSLNRSKGKYRVEYESNLAILADGKTFIGVRNDQTTLFMEDIVTGKTFGKIGKHWSDISCLIFIEESNMLLVGDSYRMIQYRLNQNKIWSKIKDYGEIGIGGVISCTRIMNLVIFGGTDSSLRVIDYEKRRVIGDVYKTAIRCISSLSICERPNQVVLSVNGVFPFYSDTRSDILDITELVKEYGMKKFTKKILSSKSKDEKMKTTRNVLMKSSSNQRTLPNDTLNN